MERKRRLDRYTKKNKINRTAVNRTVLSLILLGIFICAGIFIGQELSLRQLDREEDNMKPDIVDEDTSSITDVVIYIPGDSGLTEKKVRIVDNKMKLLSKMEALTKILVSMKYLPENTHLIGNIKVENNVATINFSEEIKNFHGSAEEESQVLNSITQTMVSRQDRITGIKITVMGEELDSLGGHIDLTE